VFVSGDDIGINLPGISIGSNGINLPGISINNDGINLPGISIGSNGINLPGISIGHSKIGDINDLNPADFDDVVYTGYESDSVNQL
jgi:hypothetical protein